MRSERLRGYGLALVAAGLWATLGLIYHRLEALGLPRLTIAFLRATVAALILFPVLGWRRPSWLRVEQRDWPLFVALGLRLFRLGAAPLNTVEAHGALAAWRFPDAGFERWARARARAHGITDAGELAAAVDQSRLLLDRFRNHPLFQEMDAAERRLHEVPYSLMVDGSVDGGSREGA